MFKDQPLPHETTSSFPRLVLLMGRSQNIRESTGTDVCSELVLRLQAHHRAPWVTLPAFLLLVLRKTTSGHHEIHSFISLLKLSISDRRELLEEMHPQYKIKTYEISFFIRFRRLTFLHVISMHITTIKRQFCFMTVMIFLSQKQK